MAPSYRYGRDAVFQISSALARKLLLRELRTSADLSCLSRERIAGLLEIAGVPQAARDRLDAGLALAGLEAVSVWVDELHLERRDDGQDVVALDDVSIGGPPAELVPPLPPVPLAAVAGDVSTKLADSIRDPLAQIDIELEGVSLRVAESGALGLGVELAQDRVRDELAWFTFDQDLCRVGDQAYDWALAIDAQRMTDILHVRAGRFNQSLAADPEAGFTIEEFRVPQWWPTIRLYIRGRSLDYDTGFSIEVDLHLDVDGQHRLLASFGDPDIRLRHTLADLIWLTVEGEVTTMVNDALAEAIAPIPITIDVPDGGRLLATRLVHEPGGLRVLGRSEHVFLPPVPEVAAAPDPVEFYQLPHVACAGGVGTFNNETSQLSCLRGPAFVCDAWVDGNQAFILDWYATGVDGSAQQPSPTGHLGRSVELPAGGLLGLQLYMWSTTRTDQRATLRILTNVPGSQLIEVPLLGRVEGAGVPRVTPSTLELHVANTPTGADPGPISDCREFRPPRRTAPSPVGYVSVHNDGTGPLFLCDYQLDDPGDAFAIQGAGYLQELIRPGQSLPIGVYFRPAELERRYTATLTLQTNAGDLTARLVGQVDPVQQAARVATTIDGHTLETIIDLVGERLCMPANAHICKARDVFTRPSAPGALEIARLAFHGLEDNDVLALADEDGRVAVRDFAGGPRRDIIVDYPAPDGDLGPRPCIATIDGAQSPGDLRLHLTGRLLEPGAVLYPDAAAAAVHPDGHAAIVDSDGVEIVTSLDPTGSTSPTRLHRTEVVGVSAVTWVGDRLVVAVGEDLVELDVASGGKPHRIARAHSQRLIAMGELTCAAVGSIVRVHAPDLDELDRIELAGPVNGLAVVGRRLVASGEWGSVELATCDGRLSIVREHTHPHWSRRFQPGPTPNTLVSITSGRLQTWRWRRHRLDRARFPDATRPRFPGVGRNDPAAGARRVPSDSWSRRG